MLRGTTTFKCDNCGNTFKGLDMEWCATIFTAPVRCPKCGSMHTAPKGLFGTINPIYRSLWKSIDERAEISEK